MTFSIRNDLLFQNGSQVTNVRTSRKYGGSLTAKPDLVIHYTVGENFGAMVAALSRPNAGHGSAHIVLGQKGEITQVENFRTRLWHAGTSYWKGRNNLNNSSIGIEVCNQGWLNERGDDGRWRQKQKWQGRWYTSRWFDPSEVFVGRHPNSAVYIPTFGDARPNVPAWALYTPQQMAALDGLVSVLKSTYNIRYVVGHDDISPGRKQDPGLCFDRNRFDVWNGGRDELPPRPNPTPPNTGVSSYPVLGMGDGGYAVKILQRKLAEAGFPEVGTADGRFGPKTEEALKDFQTKHGLVADGVAGPNTYAKMF